MSEEEVKKPGRPAKVEISDGLKSKDGMWQVECKREKDDKWIIVPIGENRALGRFPVDEESLRGIFGV